MDMSDNTAPAEGGKKIIILCEKVSKEDIKVRFFNYNGWEEWADLGPAGVHKQHAISLTAPRYSDPGITEAVRVGVELVRPSDDSRSEEEEFFYLPSEGQKFQCPHCEYKATQKGNLQNHIKSIHEGQKFQCPHCEYKASQKGHLQRHIKSVHEGLMFQCPQCEFKATRKGRGA